MTDPDFRALCAELLQLEQEQPAEYTDWKMRYNAAIARARAALAEPELCNLHREMVAESVARRARAALAQPEPVAPTDEDLEDLAEVMNVSGNPVPAMRRALELWGNSQGILDSSPQAEPVAPTDEELITMWATTSYIDQPEGGLAYARAVLARWGTPAINTRGTD
jgi:hypothetical protein